MRIPKSLKHLSLESQQYWRRLNEEYELPSDSLLILKVALEHYDRGTQARELMAVEGIVVDGKRHPAFDVENRAFGLFHRLMRELKLDIELPGPNGRPLSGL